MKFPIGLLLVLLSKATTIQAADLTTCTHKSGAIVYTRTPSVLGADFQCDANPEKKFREMGTNERLDPTPNNDESSDRCPSKATLKIDSSGYSGEFAAELRSGTRPGSKRINGALIGNGKSSVFANVCPGQYFFAFGPADSDEVSVTRYFTITNDGLQYSNPTITVFYSRVPSSGNKLQRTKKSGL